MNTTPAVIINDVRTNDDTPFGSITLNLTVREAKALSALSQCVAGEPSRDKSARYLFDEIRKALLSRGIDGNTGDFIDHGYGARLGFKNYV